MNADVQQYLSAADRENTVRSYAAAIRHFEVDWKGLLPATIDTVARYLAEHAAVYKISTLRLHLAALARWHADNGFADPTRSALVLKVLRGIRARHATPQRRARPLQLDVLEQASDWLMRARDSALEGGRRVQALRHGRDRSLLLLGFWRAFRASPGRARSKLDLQAGPHENISRGRCPGIPLPGSVPSLPGGCLSRLDRAQRQNHRSGLPGHRPLGKHLPDPYGQPGGAATFASHS